MTYGRRVDNNHAEIRDGLRMLGFVVWDTSQAGYGFPDLVVARGGVVRAVEVKSKGGKLTEAETRFRDAFGDWVIVAYCLEDVLQEYGLMED